MIVFAEDAVPFDCGAAYGPAANEALGNPEVAENGEDAPGIVMVLPHLAQGPDCPAYWSATCVAVPQWGQEKLIGMRGALYHKRLVKLLDAKSGCTHA